MEHTPIENPTPDQSVPFYTGEFAAADHGYRLGKINDADEMEFELKAKLNGDKTRIQICQDTGDGEFDSPIAEYDIASNYAGIIFEEDAQGFYWLRLQSGRQSAATEKYTLTHRQGLKYQIINDKLHFIGADDVRTYTGTAAGFLEKSAQIDGLPFILEIPVAPGKVAEIKYFKADQIAFNRQP